MLSSEGIRGSRYFFETQDYATYSHWLGKGAEKYGVAIHAFVLMTNHVHLLVTPPEGESMSRFMQIIGQRYVPYINQKYGRSGSIWEGRYKASLVQEDDYFLTVMQYIELNPVRAGIVQRSGQCRWSSFCHSVGLKRFVFSVSIYYTRALGIHPKNVSKPIADTFTGYIEETDIKMIREAWQTGTPLGNDWFKEKIQQQLKCKVGYARRGRPTKSDDWEKGL